MNITLEGNKRSGVGKKSSKDARRADLVPCVLYGGEEVITFEAPYNSFRKLIYTDSFHRVDLNIDGKEFQAILKDVQFDPVTDKISHVDFQELDGKKKVKVEIPVRLDGFASGVQEGGKLILKMRKVAVKAYPQDIPDFIELDVTDLELGKSIRVRDVSLPNCEVLNSPGNPVASVVVPRALKGEPLPGDEDYVAPGEEGVVPAEGDEAPAETEGEETGKEGEG